MAARLRALRWWIAGAVALVVVLAVGGPFVYIHFVEGPAPARLRLPKSTPTSAVASATASSVDGVWNVGSGSVAGYRVQEVLIGQQSTAVGRTAEVWGSLTISGTSVESGSFTVNMASVVSDQSERNAQFDGRIMDVSTYPTATFSLSSPIVLGSVPATGTVEHYPAGGRLTMHGVTRQVSFTVSAERLGSGIDVLADIPIVFADWDIANPSVGGFVTTQSSGTLEVLLDLTQGPGNHSSSGIPSSDNLGGGQVTVPSTTVPPLTVPSS
ncbi:MAG TPA: YceI family protein [Acidimicrobiales bacterium]|nr:YceI family protein [Acidimicrobiales bacterium]